MKKKTLIIIGLAWLAVLVACVSYFEVIKTSGTEIKLVVRPVDPRSPLFGDYVVLAYGVNSVPISLSRDEKISKGDTVYVGLTKTPLPSSISLCDAYCASFITKAKPHEGLYLQGEVRDVSRDEYTVSYGLEQYYVPADTGRSVEVLRGKGLVAVISVSLNGKAILNHLEYEGKRVVPTK